jgi:predicted DNA-binding transcriptional regulator AlpA
MSETFQRAGEVNAVPLLLTTGEAASLLGMSERALRRADQCDKVPEPVRIGRNVRWRAAELSAWVEAGCPDRTTWAAVATEWPAVANRYLPVGR